MIRRSIDVLAVAILASCIASAASLGARIQVLTIDGEIGRGTVSYVRAGLTAAQEAGAELVVIRLATPGGLLDSAFAVRDLLLSAEIPTIAAPTEYAPGFMLGTVLLHLTGVLIGDIAQRYKHGVTVLRIGGGVSVALGFLFILGVL